MKSKSMLMTCLVGALSLSAPAAFAENAGFYIGMGAGEWTLDNGLSFDESDLALKLSAAYALNDYVAFELEYVDGSDLSRTLIDEEETLELGLSGYGLSVLGSYPFNDVFSVFARVGYAAYDIDEKLIEPVESGGVERFTYDESDLVYGAGIAFNVIGRLILRAEYEAFNHEDVDIDFLYVGALWKF